MADDEYGFAVWHVVSVLSADVVGTNSAPRVVKWVRLLVEKWPRKPSMCPVTSTQVRQLGHLADAGALGDEPPCAALGPGSGQRRHARHVGRELGTAFEIQAD